MQPVKGNYRNLVFTSCFGHNLINRNFFLPMASVSMRLYNVSEDFVNLHDSVLFM